MTSNENEFETDPLEGDFDQGGDFDEFEASDKKGSLGDVWKSSPLVKVGLVAAAVLVVIAVVSLFGGEKDQTLGSKVGGGADELKEAPGTSEVTPVMRDALEEHNQQRLEDALKQGSSNIPTPIDPPKVLLGVSESQTLGEDPLVRWKRMQEERVKLQREQEQYAAQAQVDPNKQQRIDNLQQAMLTQFQDIVGNQTVVPQLSNMQVTEVRSDVSEASPSGSTAALGSLLSGAQQTQTVSQTQEQTPLKVIVPAGQIAYAQTLVEANSDIPGPIVAQLVSGPFSGSRILGSFQKQDEYLTMRFTTLVGKDGNSIPISAVAVDPDTTLTGMATDVDHKYWQRVILPAAAQFIQSLGQAYAEKGTTSVTVNSATGESTTTETNDIDVEQEFAQATSDAAEKVGEIFDDEADVEVLVRVRAGVPFGLLFTSPVTDQQIDASKYAPSTQQATQQQQQPSFFQQMTGTGTPVQMLQQGLGNQTLLQQGNNLYPSATTDTTSTNGGTTPQVTYTDGLQ